MPRKAQKPAFPLVSVEDQYDQAQRRNLKSFEIGEMVKVYTINGVLRMKVHEIYDTPVEHIKLYELKPADGSYYYATKYFMGKVD